MFRRFANTIPGGANTLFLQHPSVLTALLEVAWQFRLHGPAAVPLGHPGRRSTIPQLPSFWLNPLRTAAGIGPPIGTAPIAGTVLVPVPQQQTVLWDHL